MSDDLKWTTNTHVTPFTLASNAQLTISMVLEHLFLLLHFFTRPSIFLPIHNCFYPSKWRVDGSLHKAMECIMVASYCLSNSVLHRIYRVSTVYTHADYTEVRPILKMIDVRKKFNLFSCLLDPKWETNGHIGDFDDTEEERTTVRSLPTKHWPTASLWGSWRT